MTTIGDVCLAALADYKGCPWLWPRESDLVAHLVQEIKKELGSSERIKAKAQYRSKTAGVPKAELTTTKVRTEAKLEDVPKPPQSRKTTSGASTTTQTKADEGNDKQRIDICLLKESTTLHILNAGIRDIDLRVYPNEIDEILEVKLAPHHYLKDDQTLWLSDLIKLWDIRSAYARPEQDDQFRLNAPMHLLSIDTGLPIEGLYQPPNVAPVLTMCQAENLKKCFPLVKGERYQFTQAGRTVVLESIDPEACSSSSSEIYFWALGVEAGTKLPEQPEQILDDKSLDAYVIPWSEYVAAEPACWKVTEVTEVNT